MNMRDFIGIWLGLLFTLGVQGHLVAQHFGFSSGLYRVPYVSSTIVEVASDVYTHDPLGKYDLLTAASNPVVVAAADGWVRWIQESFDTACYQNVGGVVTCCWQFNNYLIIEHPNGEWSQYTHMDQNSSTNAGITLNQWVTAGTPIGTEGTVGCSTGDHVHLEVGRPFNPAFPFDTIGGFLHNTCELLIPVIRGIGTAKSFMEDSDVIIASSAADNCPTSLTLSADLGNGDQYVGRADDFITTNDQVDVVYANGSTAIYRAGDYVLLKPGFRAAAGSKFVAIIRTCNQQN